MSTWLSGERSSRLSLQPISAIIRDYQFLCQKQITQVLTIHNHRCNNPEVLLPFNIVEGDFVCAVQYPLDQSFGLFCLLFFKRIFSRISSVSMPRTLIPISFPKSGCTPGMFTVMVSPSQFRTYSTPEKLEVETGALISFSINGICTH